MTPRGKRPSMYNLTSAYMKSPRTRQCTQGLNRTHQTGLKNKERRGQTPPYVTQKQSPTDKHLQTKILFSAKESY